MTTSPFPWALLSALVALGACRPSPEEELRTFVEALPELPAEVAATLDTATMATMRPALVMPTEQQRQQYDTVAAAFAPCCQINVRRELMVEYEITSCRNPYAIDFGDLSTLAVFRSGKAAPNARHAKLTSLRGAKFIKPFWCTTSLGPWPAILDDEIPCQVGHWYSLTVFGPDGPITFPRWQGGEELLPAGIRVVDCKRLYTQRLSCGGIGNCNCTSSACNPPQDCTCPLF